MKICYLADGQSIHVHKWCNHFSSLRHEVHLVSFKNVLIKGTHVHFVNAGEIKVEGGNWQVLFQWKKIKKLIEIISPDVLHAFYATSYGMMGALSGFHPFIVTPLGTDVLIDGQRSMLYRYALRYVFAKANHVTSMAGHMTDAIKRIGIDPAKISPVIFGVNTQLFNRTGRNLDSGSFVITSTRNLEPVYGIPCLIEALSRIKDKIPGLHINIIGDGSLKESLKEMIAKKGLTSQVTFHGKISQEEVARVLKRSHIYVSTSLSDGNSLSLIEAMACGALPVTTAIPANREWIVDEENGLLAGYDNAEILADKLLLAYRRYPEFADKAATINEELISRKGCWQVNSRKIEQVYLSFCKKNR